MNENLARQFAVLPDNLLSHLLITIIPLAAGLLISLPLAIFVVKRPRLRYPALTTVGVVQTIPSLALLALMVPLLAAASALTERFAGIEITPIGFAPTVIALTLYSMLPIVRNTVVGLTSVEPAVVEAARGVGMTPRQILLRVELPLAAPVIIAGIRTSAVWVVGIATLATPVGQKCLGDYIFPGLQTQNWTAVLFGCVAAAALAITLDLLIGGVERSVARRRRALGYLSGGAIAVIALIGLTGPWLLDAVENAREPVGEAGDRGEVWIGSKTFTEQYILASLIGDIVADAGYAPRYRQSLGSTVIFDALVNGDIDVYVDYSGTIWANHMGRTEIAGGDVVLREMDDWLAREHDVVLLGPLGFENAYGLAMRSDRAAGLDITTIADLAPHAPEMKIGGDYEFFGRPEWRTISDAYQLEFGEQIRYDSTFMYSALIEGAVDVISAFTSDGRIAAHDLLILNDPRNAIPPYDAVLLLSPEAQARLPELAATLDPLIGSIPVDVMRRANLLVDREEDKQTVPAAASWLREQIGL